MKLFLTALLAVAGWKAADAASCGYVMDLMVHELYQAPYGLGWGSRSWHKRGTSTSGRKILPFTTLKEGSHSLAHVKGGYLEGNCGITFYKDAAGKEVTQSHWADGSARSFNTNGATRKLAKYYRCQCFGSKGQMTRTCYDRLHCGNSTCKCLFG